MDFLVSTALAQATEGAQAAGQQPSMFETMLPLLLLFVVMYFIMIRPQAKKAKEHANLLKALKAGDEVVTSGGIIGRIRSVADEFVTLDVGSAHFKVMKEHISRHTRPQADKAENQAEKAAKKAPKAVAKS